MRSAAVAGLLTVAVLALVCATITGFATRTLFDSDRFAARAMAALDDDAVSAEVARRVADGVLEAQRDLLGVRPLIEGAASGVVSSAPFRTLFGAAVRDVHASVFDRDAATVTLTVRDVGVLLRGVLLRVDPEVGRRLEGGAAATITDAEPPAAALDLAQLAEDVRGLAVVLALLALVTAAAGLTLARDRRTAVARASLGLVAAALLALLGLGLLRAAVVGDVEDPDTRAAATGVWDALFGGLRTALLALAGAAAVTGAAARSLLRPLELGAARARLWQRLATPPQATWARVARALALIAAGALIAASPLRALELAGTALGLLVLAQGVDELLRLVTLPRAGAETPRAPVRARRRQLVVGGALVAVAVAVVGLALGTGTTAPVASVVRGCNGDRALCDRSLDEVTLPATHNAMSAADAPGYLFALHERGVLGQLEDGIRGLLLDTHYGLPTSGGRVKTDLADVTNVARAKWVEEIGEEALDAALRIRDRIGDAADASQRGIYLCHSFCELGATSLEDSLEQIEAFLDANRGEVIVIVNQDEGVAPEDFVAAVEESGLDRHVFRGPAGAPWPTLGEMVRRDQRVLLLAENAAGAAPWYHPAYEVMQETPFKFSSTRELTDPDGLERSCRPNRGPADASLFLVNHWVDTSPLGRPSNAAAVNGHDELVRRARTCERVRGQRVNLLAVDFYLTGEVVRAAATLNAEAAP